MWKDALWDLVYFVWLSVPPQEAAAPGEGPLSAADWGHIDAWRGRCRELLPADKAFPTPDAFKELLALAQLRYAFFVAVVVAVGAADEWEDNNPQDHQVWTRNIALRQDRMWERELSTGEMAATLDRFAPRGRPWSETLLALHHEGERMKEREVAKRRRKGHA